MCVIQLRLCINHCLSVLNKGRSLIIHRPCQQYSISSFFLIFAKPYSAPPPFDFLATLCQLPYMEMYTDHVDTTLSLSTTVFLMSILFFLILRLYLNQLLYWEMGTDHINNASTLSKESTSNLSFFFCFFLILLYLHELPYQEMGTDHVNNTPTLLKMVYVMLLHSFLIFS